MRAKNDCTDARAGERLGAYEMGVLSPEEAAGFERHLTDCASCQEELFEMAPAFAEIRGAPGRYASVLAQQARQDDAPAFSGRFSAWLRTQIEAASWRSLVPAAATVAILIAVFVQQRSGPDWEDLARVEAVPYVQMPTRGMHRDAEARFREGMASYVQKDYAESARQLSALLPKGEAQEPGMLRDHSAFFAGLSFLLDGHPEQATVYLRIAAESPQPVVRDRSLWFLAQAALLHGNPEQAREILGTLTEASPGYGRQAAEQLEAIGRMQAD